MNSNDVNSIINNLCDKLGTTANKLIPEMASYQIARHSIWMFISLIFIGIAIGFIIKLLWMKKMDGKVLALYPDQIRKLDEKLKNSGIEDDLPQWTWREWQDTLDKVRRVRTTYQCDESVWCLMIIIAVTSGITGLVIFGIALSNLIGWHLAPHAMTVTWILNQLGGMQ